jgi:head-tail adaptor
MPLLSDSDIASMRATLLDSLAGTAVIQTRSFTDNAGGGGTISWSNAGTVACRLASLSGMEREMGARIAEDAKWILTIPASGTVTTDSRFTVTGTGHDGTYEALAIRAWTPSISKRIECREVV